MFGLCLALASLAQFLVVAEPRTVAERTNYAETSRQVDVVAFGESLAKLTPKIHISTFGTSGEGRPLALWILSDPPIDSPEAAAKSGKPVVLAFANIHAGEVDGKEALQALARDLSFDKDTTLLKKLVILFVPNLNADGNETIDPKHRREQNGPKAGVGLRENAAGLDLNRDFVKLETPEVRALVRLVTKWDPLLVVDCHTTNGSKHRYTLTYDGPRHPAADPRIIEASRTRILPDIAKRVKRATGFDTFTYGNFENEHTVWESYPATPRFGVQYLALRGCIGLLSESYTYATFSDRVKASAAFVLASFEYVAENAAEVKKVAAEARNPRSRVALRTKAIAYDTPATVLGFDEPNKSEQPKEHVVKMLTKVVPTLEIDLPAAYIVPVNCKEAIEVLKRHGIVLEEFREQLTVEATSYRITEFKQAERAFQAHKLTTVEVAPAKIEVVVHTGSVLVRTAQPLGMLAAFLLEPQSEDGLTAWNFFREFVAPNATHPVIRLATVPLALTGPVAVLPEDEPKKKPITLETLLGGRGPGGGLFGVTIDWLPDGEHFLQSKQGKLAKVEARTGKAEPYFDAEKLRLSLKALKDMPAMAIEALVRSPFYRWNMDRTAILFDLGPDLGLAFIDGSPAVRLTTSPAGKEFVSLNPDGTSLAFVRAANLYAVDFATKVETKLTTDGGGEILNGKADWVYEEEIFNRNGKAFWWSPDGKSIAFLRFDDAPVKKFAIANPFPNAGGLELLAFPKAGDPNPTVKLGVVKAAGGPVQYLDLTGYAPESTLISRVGWLPNGTPFAYVQNREQTWLDFLTWPKTAEKPVKLFRETTKAWVEDLGEPHFLNDGSFLILSERTGWKHLYHYAGDGKLLRQITDGPWEISSIHRFDESDGFIYISSTKDGSARSNFYRVSTGGEGEVKRLTEGNGTHRVSMAPRGNLFVDRFSDESTPTQAALVEIGRGAIRTLDANPLRNRDEFVQGKTERVQVSMKDGFQLEAAVTYPPDFDAKQLYPIWVLTYAGPHAPTVQDGYNSRLFEQVLAQSGIVVFRVDPRSASGKGAISAWTAYKKLGVGELKDLEEAVAWLAMNPWADAKRVGISGHSYGGYITAFALTHSKVFSAGIAGAPVTDWHLYDSIYTERYMGLPKDNKAGYEASSVVKAAANLHGKLLIIHGMIDDNVHLQNSAQFIDALQRAGKQFEIMIYPRSRHGIGGPHYTRLQIEFIQRVMEVGKK